MTEIGPFEAIKNYWNIPVRIKITMATTKTYRRAIAVSPGIGKKLDSITDRDVLLTNFRVDQRVQGVDRTEKSCVMLTIATDIDKPDDTELYHAWSQSLADRLIEIPGDQLPLIIKFVKVTTTSGTNAWSFE